MGFLTLTFKLTAPIIYEKVTDDVKRYKELQQATITVNVLTNLKVTA